MRIVSALLVVTACAPNHRDPAPTSAARLWDDAALAGWAVPVAGLGVPPTYLRSADYYAAPVDNLRTYPVYHPSREPPGYREGLLAAGPQPLIETADLTNRQAWVEAGRQVFDALDTPASRTADPDVIAHFTNAASIDRYRDDHHDVVSAEGVLLDYRWVVGTDGVLRVSLSSCAGCHARLMPDGSVLPGAPSNYDLSEAPAVRKLLAELDVVPGTDAGGALYARFGVPWRPDDPHARFRTMTDAELAALQTADTGAEPGTMFARTNGSPLHPTRMADLRGVAHRRYLDTTATHRNRGPEDVARYGIAVEYAESGSFGPYSLLPMKPPRVRPPDEAMLAMALYLYSLEPAPSPHPFDDAAARGKQVFEDLACDTCHPPPDYTTQELVAVDGFVPPPRHGLQVSRERVGTDPSLALLTRKGTGYYRIPSLRGLWYRGALEHEGSVATLEDWFDARRLRADYTPTGFRGTGITHRAVPGHEFGLDLATEDKRALIAFLKTL